MSKPSIVNRDNRTRELYTIETISNKITNGVITIGDSTIKGLSNPVDPQDAVPRGFIDSQGGISGPPHSVQFNDNGTFGGSQNLIYENDILKVNGTIKDGSGITISGSTISGLNDPVNGNEIATKRYTDNSSSSPHIYVNTIESDTDVVYTASQMINNVIMRNLETMNITGEAPGNYGSILTDTTASAADLIASVPGASAGHTVSFRLVNDTMAQTDESGVDIIESRDGTVVNLIPGQGVKFFPDIPVEIRRSYVLDAYLIFDNIETPEVTMVINNIYFSGLNIYESSTEEIAILSNKTDFFNYGSSIIENVLLFNYNERIYNENEYHYTTNDIKNQLIVRNPTADANDYFGYGIDLLYLNQIIIIQNISDYNINVLGQTDLWDLYPSPMIIGPKSAMHISVNINNFYLEDEGNHYDMGMYDVTGGTGTGMKIQIGSVWSRNTMVMMGSGYIETEYNTTNLTNPSATGLRIMPSMGSIDHETGGIGSIDIRGYVGGEYEIGDLIQVNGGNNDATFTLDSVDSVLNYRIMNIGNGEYLSTDTVEISGPGPGLGGILRLESFLTVYSAGIMSI